MNDKADWFIIGLVTTVFIMWFLIIISMFI